MEEVTMTLYDMVKQTLSAEVPMDAIVKNRKIAEMSDFIRSNSYTLLFNKERADVTMFTTVSARLELDDVNEALLDCLNNRGILLLADKLEDGNYEIWIRDAETEENFCYYLFPYHEGVIEVY